ncbi:MAG TPA: DUF4350 domain-containing protein [Pyrinomonadaceae bacterium]|nr:DUF4350 domain-containing protein [Pyrinomonadaceae bacterium]
MRLLLAILTLLVCLVPAFAQQQADPEFDTSVARPAYKKDGPRVMFDEAHHNFHTTDGRYKPFVDLLLNDGYNVVRNRQPFIKSRLSGFKILVIANALGAEEDDDKGADEAAFTEEEIAAVAEWVKDGGALLLIADHAPFGGAAAALSSRFGVDMSKGYTFDPENSVAGSPTQLLFSRENKLLANHSIAEGRNENERIKLVRSFTGQSLKGPEGSIEILKLADSASDRPTYTDQTSTSAAGRAQAIALKFGKGRVVVHGEAAMLSAQISGPDKRTMGMNVPGNDNKQYTINLMHWLSGILK